MPHITITITTSTQTLGHATPPQADDYCQLLHQTIADLFPAFDININRDDSLDFSYASTPPHTDCNEILRIDQAIADTGHLEHAGYWEQEHVRYTHRYDEALRCFVVKDVLTGRELRAANTTYPRTENR